MLKWPGLHYMTSAFAPKHYPKDIIDFANTRGSDKVMYCGYFPAGLTLERQFRDMPNVPFNDERVAEVPARERHPRASSSTQADAAERRCRRSLKPRPTRRCRRCSPTERSSRWACSRRELAPGLRQIEIYTMRGLLGLQWHGPAEAERIVARLPRRDGRAASARGTALYPALGRAPRAGGDRDGGRRLPATVEPGALACSTPWRRWTPPPSAGRRGRSPSATPSAVPSPSTSAWRWPARSPACAPSRRSRPAASRRPAWRLGRSC